MWVADSQRNRVQIKFSIISSLPVLYHWGPVSFPGSGQTEAGSCWPLERGRWAVKGWSGDSFGVHWWWKKSVHLESTLDTHTSEPPAHCCSLKGEGIGFYWENIWGWWYNYYSLKEKGFVTQFLKFYSKSKAKMFIGSRCVDTEVSLQVKKNPLKQKCRFV